MGKSSCLPKVGMTKGAWTAIEDQILKDYVNVHGEGKWGAVPKRSGLKRCGKSCRLRWLNYLRPDIKRGNITPEEDDLIIRLHNLLGNRWSLIAGRLPGRTDNEIKNYWNTNLSKRAIGLKPPTRNNCKKKLNEKKIAISDPSSTSGSLVTPRVHQLPEHYQFNGATNNVETISTPPTSKGDGQCASSDDFIADFDVGDFSGFMPELLGMDFTDQLGQEFLPFGQQQHWSCGGIDQPKDNLEAEFGCWSSLLGSSNDQEWAI